LEKALMRRSDVLDCSKDLIIFYQITFELKTKVKDEGKLKTKASVKLNFTEINTIPHPNLDFLDNFYEVLNLNPLINNSKPFSKLRDLIYRNNEDKLDLFCNILCLKNEEPIQQQEILKEINVSKISRNMDTTAVSTFDNLLENEYSPYINQVFYFLKVFYFNHRNKVYLKKYWTDVI
jgi:hypothetical protein